MVRVSTESSGGAVEPSKSPASVAYHVATPAREDRSSLRRMWLTWFSTVRSDRVSHDR